MFIANTVEDSLLWDADIIESCLIIGAEPDRVWNMISDLCDKFGTGAVIENLSQERFPNIWEFLK